MSFQGWDRPRRRYARDRRPDRRRQELRKGASPRHHPRPSSISSPSFQIHYISESIRCCGAGTAADTEFVTAMISSNMELHALSTGRKPHVVTAMTLLKQHLYKYVFLFIFLTVMLNPKQKISRACWRCTRSRGCRHHRSTTLHHPSSRFYRQASLCDDGIRKPCSHGRL